MKQRQLEILLQHVPAPTKPKPSLEQYQTPATIAADILFTAFQWEDIENKRVTDLGCGTGMFAVGAALLGAQQVLGFDVDNTVITLAKEYANTNKLHIEFQQQNVEAVDAVCDTILMNPPFGAQKSNKNADRKFIEKGFELSQVMYSLHLKKTIPFLEKMIHALQGEITFQKDYMFPIKWQFDFHKKRVINYEVTLLRITTHP
jgi:putative methylase